MNRSATQFVAAGVAVTLLAVSCGSDGSGDTAGDAPDQGDIVAEDLYGTWVTEDGEFTLDFSDDDSTLTFTSEHFDGCESAYEHRIADLEVDLHIECESDGDLAEGQNAAGYSFYAAEWTLAWQMAQRSDAEEGSIGPAAPGEFAAGAPIAELTILTIDEHEDSTVDYTAAEGFVLCD